jgi:putative ABC transport system permease protein
VTDVRESGIRAGVRRLFRLPLRSRVHTQADADEELSSFIDERVADLVSRGATESDARAEALRRLGGSSLAGARRQLQQSAMRRERRMRVRDWFETIAQDVRFGARQLARAPGVAAIAVFTLAVGIGANAAIFAMIDAVLLRTLPVELPSELVAVGKTTAIDGHTTGSPRGDLLSLPMYRELQRDNRLVTGLAASGTARQLDVRIADTDADEHPNGRFVSANYFAVLRVPAERGRTFEASGDDTPPGALVVVISDAYWRSRFGAATEAIGHRININGALLTIIGVAQRGFDGDVVERPTQIFLPISIQPIVQPHSAPIVDPGTSWLLLLGRLAPGVTLDEARAGFTTRIRSALVAMAGSPGEAAYLRREPIVISSGAHGFSAARVNFRAALLTMQIGVVLLLLIVCTNLANLLVGRALARRTEMSVRLALGAGRRRLLRQLMTESVLLALLGAAAGAALGWWGSTALGRVATTTNSPVAIAGALDARVLGFTFGVCVVAVLCFGLAPALLASRVDLAFSMRAHTRSVIARGGRRGARVPIGASLVPLQVALCVVLLTGAALLARSLSTLESRETGLDRDHLIVAETDANRRGLTGEHFMTEATEMTARLAAIPGVRAVTYSQNGLFLGHDGSAVVAVPGFVGRTEEDSSLSYDLVGPGYLHAIGGRLLRGRDINEHDAAKAPRVAVLNESAARFLFAGGNAIGKVIYFDEGVPTTVVGVVADIRDHSLVNPVDRRAYVAYAQEIAGDDHPFLSFTVRTNIDPATLVRDVRRTIATVDPELPQIGVSTVHDLMRDTIKAQQLVSTLAAAFGLAALLLALVGLYGVMSYAVTRRTAELGLRSALGAERGDVLRLVLGDGLRLVAIGLVVGVPLALVASRVLGAQLHGLPSADPVSLAIAAGAIAVCAFVAALIPALRASRVSPALALAQD